MNPRVTVMRDDLGLVTGPPERAVFSTLEDVVAAAGAEPVRVVVANELTASSDMSVPANLTLEFTSQGRLNVAAGVTVTILGHVFAPARRIFEGAGTVVFESDSCVIFPGWWGSGDGVRIGKLESTQVTVVNLAADQVAADLADIATLRAGAADVTGTITAGGRITGVEVYEGSMRVGTDRVAKAGDTMLGPLFLARYPELPNEAAHRAYVEDMFSSLKLQAEATNSFGILIWGGANKIEAARPLDVIGFVDGYGITVTKGAALHFTDGAAEFSFVDDAGNAVGIGDENGLVFALNEHPGSATLAAADSVPSGRRTIRVSGDGGAVDLTSNPQVVPGSFDGQQLYIVGDDDTNTVELDHGDGLALVGGAPIVLGAGDCLALRWDDATSTWCEMFRANV